MKGKDTNALRFYDYDEKLFISASSHGQDFCRGAIFFFLIKKYKHEAIVMRQIIRIITFMIAASMLVSSRIVKDTSS